MARMDVDRFEGVQSVVPGWTEVTTELEVTVVSADGVGDVVGITEDIVTVVGITAGSGTMLLAGVVGIVVLLAAAAGALIAYRRRSGSSDEPLRFAGDTDSSPRDGSSAGDIGSAAATAGASETTMTEETAETSGGAEHVMLSRDVSTVFDEQIGEQTLNRLEPVVPDAVRQVREQLPLDQHAAPDAVDAMERDLRQAVKDTLDKGEFDPTVISSLGEKYAVVNLPERFRELTVPPEGNVIHIADLEAVVRDALDSCSLREAGRTVATVHEHCHDIESHIRRREESYLDERREVERMLVDIREMTNRFDGTLADRVREFVVDGRHEVLPGVRDAERRLADADRSLHACEFDDADRAVSDARRNGDDLLMAVDFLSGVTGTIDHGSGRIAIPDGVAEAFIMDLVPILDRQYLVDVELDGGEIVVTGGNSVRSGDSGSSQLGDRGSPAADRSSGSSRSTGSQSATDRGKSGGREQPTPDAVADEVLFVFRELDGRGENRTVECQTERLPDAVARREVLDPLTTFCRRQTDLVNSVTLQENAPPGFFEIEFQDGTTASAGLDALRRRFVERHGG